VGSEHLAIGRVRNRFPAPSTFTSACGGTSVVTNADKFQFTETMSLILIIAHS